MRGPHGDTEHLWDCTKQQFVIGGHIFDRQLGFAGGEPLHLRLLLRSTPTGAKGMTEFYVNDVIGHPFTFDLGTTMAKLGLTDVSGSAAPISELKAWKMSLNK